MQTVKHQYKTKMHIFLSSHTAFKRGVLCVWSCHYSMYLGPTNQIVSCQDHSGTIRIRMLNIPKHLKIAILGEGEYSKKSRMVTYGYCLDFAKRNLCSIRFPLGRLFQSHSRLILATSGAHCALSIQCEDFTRGRGCVTMTSG